jgi:hypothetical protein
VPDRNDPNENEPVRKAIRVSSVLSYFPSTLPIGTAEFVMVLSACSVDPLHTSVLRIVFSRLTEDVV